MCITGESPSSCILVVLEEQSTLYMRPAAMLTKIANQFEADVVLEHKRARANGKSLLDIIMLGVTAGANFKVLASGNDAPKAIRAIRNFFSRFFELGDVSDEIANECALSAKYLTEEMETKNMEVEMRQKVGTVVKQQQASVKQLAAQNRSKAQTFVWPVAGNVGVREVCLAGDFNNWNPVPMTKRDNSFQATVNLDPGVYQYKFVVDGQWQVDPSAKGNAKNSFGTTNSVLQVN